MKIFHFFTLHLEIQDKKLNPWIFHKIVIPWKFQGQKHKKTPLALALEIPHFFLVTLEIPLHFELL